MRRLGGLAEHHLPRGEGVLKHTERHNATDKLVRNQTYALQPHAGLLNVIAPAVF